MRIALRRWRESFGPVRFHWGLSLRQSCCRLPLLLQLMTVKERCVEFVTSPNIFPSCPDFRFPPTSTDFLTIPDIRTCLYRVKFKTWAGPRQFYIAREVFDQTPVLGESYLGFLGDFENQCVFKRYNSFWLCLKKKNLSVYISLPNTEHLFFFLKWKTFSILIFSSLNFLLNLRHVLYFGRERKQQRTPCLNVVCHPRTTFPPYTSVESKRDWWFNFSVDFICSVLSIPELVGSVDMVEKALWFSYTIVNSHHVVDEKES